MPLSQFLRWTDCLLDPSRSPAEQRDAAHAWCAWGLNFLGVDENNAALRADPFFADVRLSTGKAISPLGAARCLREYRRTAVFLQAIDEAIRESIRRFPGETIHVLEAGCGPLAPLAMPFAARYPPSQLVFTLLDLHPIALDGARRVAQALGVNDSIRSYLHADASTVQFAESERPHIVACEVLLRALTREPQVAVTRHLAPQLLPGGVFLPDRIDVDAGLFDASEYFADARWNRDRCSDSRRTAMTDLGTAFALDAKSASALRAHGPSQFVANPIRIPAHDRHRTPLRLFTRIRVFGHHRLGDFDSSLNLPSAVNYPAELAARGGEIQFVYEVSSDPGLRIEKCTVGLGS